MHCGRLSLLTFFGETKKVSGCRAAPGNAPSSEENKAHQSTMLRKQRNAQRVVRPSRLQRHSARHPEGAMHCGRLSLLTFFGETKKVSGCRAAPGNAPSSEENKAHQSTMLRKQRNAQRVVRPSRLQRHSARHPEGAMHCGRLSLLTFFGETKKVSGCRAAPGNAPSSEENKAHQSTMLRKQRNAKRVVRPSRLQRHSTRHPEGAMHCGRLSLLTFFGETKKVSGCRAAPGNAPPVRRKQTSSNNRTRYQQIAQPENQAWCATSQEYVCARHTRHTYRALSVHTRSARPPTDRKRYKVPQHKQANAQCQRRPMLHATTPSLRWR